MDGPLNTQQLVEAYARVRGAHALPPMEPGALTIHSEPRSDADAVWRELVEFQPDSGWVCLQSSVRDSDAGPDWLKAPDAASGLLLSAEAHRRDDDRTLHIRQTGNGWRLTWFEGTGSERCPSDLVALIVHNPGAEAPRRLQYRRYWTHDPAMGMIVHAARFIGFTGQQG